MEPKELFLDPFDVLFPGAVGMGPGSRIAGLALVVPGRRWAFDCPTYA